MFHAAPIREKIGWSTADHRVLTSSIDRGLAALTTPEGVLVDVNPAFSELLGRSADELHGTSVHDLIHADVAPAAREAHADLLADHSRPMRHESRLVRADGTAVPVQLTASWVEETPEGQAARLGIRREPQSLDDGVDLFARVFLDERRLIDDPRDGLLGDLRLTGDIVDGCPLARLAGSRIVLSQGSAPSLCAA